MSALLISGIWSGIKRTEKIRTVTGRCKMDGRKAQTIEKLADGILSLSIALGALTTVKVLPTVSESFQIWCILIFNSAIGLGWLLGSARMWKKIVAVLLLLLCVLGLLVNRAFLF